MIETWSTGCSAAHMQADMLCKLQENVFAHPWWNYRSRLLIKLFAKLGIEKSQSIADVGCGWGTNLIALENAGFQVTGFDISIEILRMLDKPTRHLVVLDLVKDLPKNHKSFDATIALDVLEHIDDDRDALRKLSQMTKPNGRVIVSVPALPELFSDFDVVQGHRRRYTKATLEDIFRDSDLTLIESRFWCQWMVPIVKMQRKKTTGLNSDNEEANLNIYAQYVKPPNKILLPLLNYMFARDEKRTLEAKNVTGTSLFAIGVKNA